MDRQAWIRLTAVVLVIVAGLAGCRNPQTSVPPSPFQNQSSFWSNSPQGSTGSSFGTPGGAPSFGTPGASMGSPSTPMGVSPSAPTLPGTSSLPYNGPANGGMDSFSGGY